MKKYILSLAAVFVSFAAAAPTTAHTVFTAESINLLLYKRANVSWDSLKAIIKESEGLVLTNYNCAAGYATIGYGHLNTERYSAISQEQADKMLQDDLFYGVDFLRKHTKLKGNRLKAISKFVYAFGTYKLWKSNLFKLIKAENFGTEFDAEYVKWCKINNRENSHLKKARLIELQLFHSQDAYIN
jgi:GH24 family phage-related lysozyme (muramidase)